MIDNSVNHMIYVVEDDEDDCYLLKNTLLAYDVAFNMHFLANGSELIIHLTHKLSGRLPDVILLDLNMPVMNGFDTLRLLKGTDQFRHIPVIIRTAYEDDDYMNRSYEMGCQAYITKSKHPLELIKVIQQFHPAIG
jgi:CheY-like chemotaxis protein